MDFGLWALGFEKLKREWLGKRVWCCGREAVGAVGFGFWVLCGVWGELV